MNDDEAAQTFRSVSDILRTAQLDWLVDEALAEIRRGKPKAKKVRVPESSEFLLIDEDPEPARGRSATFVESIEYSHLEQLEILISALERAVVAPTFMEGEIASVLSRTTAQFAQSIPSMIIKFVAEETEEGTRESTKEDRDKRRNLGNKLSNTISRFREALHAAD
jgi:hypothetical protein